jgi:hypothetical protein
MTDLKQRLAAVPALLDMRLFHTPPPLYFTDRASSSYLRHAAARFSGVSSPRASTTST